MDSFEALAILAFCAGAHAAALPQLPGLNLGAGTATTAAAGPATGSAAADVAVGKPTLPAVAGILPAVLAVPAAPGVGLPNLPVPGLAGGLPSVPKLPGLGDLLLPIPNVAGGGLPIPELLKVPAVGDLLPPVPNVGAGGLPVPGLLQLPAVGDLPLPLSAGGAGPKLPVIGELPVPLLLPVPDLPLPDLSIGDLPTGDLTDLASANALSKVVALGTTVLEVILSTLSKGASLLPWPGTDLVHSLPVGALPNGSLPINKSQVTAPKPLPAAGGLTGVLGGVTSGLPVVSGSSSPLNTVTGLTNNSPRRGWFILTSKRRRWSHEKSSCCRGTYLQSPRC
ncbi:hypothetical protein K458DRAFT_69385 [Lentithecium fluviatile CBS 122367]|uniref:Uncharacterized protein n=1 Tax=Lentithecium fluviatile CBS 122367 TaxID=1168545 RepID=A0A6G1JMA9_9PLEO|nr:hypothetical protein K458DRAFT_69385 [Lentithecium fluviatile CBS 122367]